jgi:hypothetical protein
MKQPLIKHGTFVNDVKYLGMIFGKRITWKLRMEMMEAKAFRTFISVCFLFISERLRANIKLTFQIALMSYVIIKLAPPGNLGQMPNS